MGAKVVKLFPLQTCSTNMSEFLMATQLEEFYL